MQSRGKEMVIKGLYWGLKAGLFRVYAILDYPWFIGWRSLSTCPIIVIHSWNEDFYSSSWKEKDLKDCFNLGGAYRTNWRAWRQEILVRGHTCFFKAKEIWKEPGDFRLDFQVLTVIFLKCLKNLFKIAVKLPCNSRLLHSRGKLNGFCFPW